MNSRERVRLAINHKEADRVPFDIGGTNQTGIACSVLAKLSEAYGIDIDAVKVQEPMQMLGRVEENLRQLMGVDVIGLFKPTNNFGIKNTNEKLFVMPDGTKTLMGRDFQFDIDHTGNTLVYPQGNRSAKPSAMMPKTGCFFDGIVRSGEMDEDDLDAVSHYGQQYSVFSDETAKEIEAESKRLFTETDLSVVGVFGGCGFGDAASLPGVSLLEPKGIRKMDDFLMAHYLYPDYIHQLFDYQTKIALKNLEIYKEAVGDRIDVIFMGGTDFGTQNCEIISKEMFQKFYKPYFKIVNDYVHKNTNWKVMYHSCGSIYNILDDMVEMGLDILNPVQCSAKNMEPERLKREFGDKITFWGGGVDTQKTLPFGTRAEVEKEVEERLNIFSKNGGFVFSAVHNIVSKTPIDNLMALIEKVKNFRFKS